MGRRGRPISRDRRPRVERSRLLLVTEGEVTEVQYLQGLAQQLRASGTAIRGIRTKGIGRDPLRVVEAAIRMSEGEGFDEVWVVVDVDEHDSLAAAIKVGREHKIPVVVSNPCFEIWLLWHYEDCRASQTHAQLERKLARHGHDGKHVPSIFPYDAWEVAADRCRHHETSHSNLGRNPSSAMPDAVKAMAGPAGT